MTCFGKLVGVVVIVGLVSACQPRESNEPIVVAVGHNDTDLVTQYLTEGGDPDLKNRNGNPLMYIASGPRGGKEVLGLLLNAGANPNALSGEGRSALQNAASWCNMEIVKLLIESGANVNLVGKDGEKPIDSVCKSPEGRRAAMIELFKAAGAVGG